MISTEGFDTQHKMSYLYKIQICRPKNHDVSNSNLFQCFRKDLQPDF